MERRDGGASYTDEPRGERFTNRTRTVHPFTYDSACCSPERWNVGTGRRRFRYSPSNECSCSLMSASLSHPQPRLLAISQTEMSDDGSLNNARPAYRALAVLY